MEHMVPLSYLQSMSLHWQMDWDLTRAQSGITIGNITNSGAFPAGHSTDVIGLLPGLVRHEYPRVRPQAGQHLHQQIYGGEW